MPTRAPRLGRAERGAGLSEQAVRTWPVQAPSTAVDHGVDIDAVPACFALPKSIVMPLTPARSTPRSEHRASTAHAWPRQAVGAHRQRQPDGEPTGHRQPLRPARSRRQRRVAPGGGVVEASALDVEVDRRSARTGRRPTGTRAARAAGSVQRERELAVGRTAEGDADGRRRSSAAARSAGRARGSRRPRPSCSSRPSSGCRRHRATRRRTRARRPAGWGRPGSRRVGGGCGDVDVAP